MKKMRHMKRKALVALVLSVTMLLTLMPGLVFGVSDAQSSPDTVSSPIDYPTVNFTDVAPFLPPVSGAAPRRSPARAAGDANTGSDNGNNGMAVNKTSVYNEDTGAYDITLEAYATGSKIISTVTSDVPTDVILVLDQSGSMGDDMEQLVYTAYSGNARQNSMRSRITSGISSPMAAMSPLPSPPGTTASNTPPSPTEEITKIMIGGPAQRTQISGITKMTFTPRSMANTRRSP